MNRESESGCGSRLPAKVWQTLAVLCLLADPLGLRLRAAAQMNMSGHTMEMRDETPPGELPVPRMIAGIGNAHMEITATPEAQLWFNQGLNLLYDFWDYESARAFEQSVRVDPQCAMCYWGLYQAESFYHSTAQGYAGRALAKAVGLKSKASERERLYIEASVAHEEAMESVRPRSIAPNELDLWRTVVRDYPKDLNARIFLSGVVDYKERMTILQSFLKDEPNSSAANHYYIHAVEGGEHPEQALHSAEILAGLAPASGHMVHMPGHIFFRIGDYGRAEQAFAMSMRVDERYMREQRVQPDNDWNYVHNLMYAVANLLEEGKWREAIALSAKVAGARGELESTLYIYSARDSISRLNPSLPVALRAADWTWLIKLLNMSPVPEGQPSLEFLARQLSGFAAGMFAVDNRDLRKAEEASIRFDAGLWRMSDLSKNPRRAQAVNDGHKESAAGAPKLQVMPDALPQPLLSNLSVMSLELRASLLAAQRRTKDAKDMFAKAAREEKALGYHEPPNYIRPVGEAEGAALMAVGDWAGARAGYERALLERPRSGLALYGIALSTEKAGDSDAAANEYMDFLAAWKDADATLPQVKHARAYLKIHPSAPRRGPKP